MKIVVTGGAGFIGSHVVDAYINQGYDVIVIDNLKTGTRKNINSKARFYMRDIKDAEGVLEIFEKEKPDVVNHHAAQMNVRRSIEDPKEDAETNIIGLINVLNAAVKTKVKRIIFISSGGAIYGQTTSIPTKETTMPQPLSPYGLSKYVGEQYLQLYHSLYQIPYVILRYANVYGQRQNPEGEAGVIAIFINKIIKNQEPIIFGDGEQTRDYMHVKDVVEANVLALSKGTNNTVNIGTGVQTSVNKLFSTMKKEINFPKSPIYQKEITGEVRHGALDSNKAKEILYWTPKIKIEQGIKETIKAMRENI